MNFLIWKPLRYVLVIEVVQPPSSWSHFRYPPGSSTARSCGSEILFFSHVEGWTWDQSLYFAMVTMSTVGVLPAPVGIVLVFGQLIDIVDLVIQPLFKKSRDLVERLVPAHYVLSAAIFIAAEPRWDMWTALYYVMVTATTVGYGDLSMPKQHLAGFQWTAAS
eukprot:Skav232909  [mRNA]  locus=scaffold1477:524828:529741:- [translate_table: standard]